MDDSHSRLEEIRIELGLKKGKFAGLLGISSSYYSHILSQKGTANLRLDHLDALLQKKGVSPRWVLTGEGDKYVSQSTVQSVTHDWLFQQVTEGFPKGWEDTYMSVVVHRAVDDVIAAQSTLTPPEQKALALQVAMSYAIQLQRLVHDASRPGDTVHLVLEGKSFSFRQPDIPPYAADSAATEAPVQTRREPTLTTEPTKKKKGDQD